MLTRDEARRADKRWTRQPHMAPTTSSRFLPPGSYQARPLSGSRNIGSTDWVSVLPAFACGGFDFDRLGQSSRLHFPDFVIDGRTLLTTSRANRSLNYRCRYAG